MKALIIGLGSIGIRHANNLHALGVEELYAYRQSDTELIRPVPENLKVFRDLEQALAVGPDLVVIANPTALHIPFTGQALKSGAHVYLEKPISHDTQGVSEIMQLASDKKLNVMVGCQLRFHPVLCEVKQWLEQGRAGRILAAQVDMGEYLPDWHPWEDYRTGYAARADLGGGVLLTQIHDLDYVHWLFGPLRNVYALGGDVTPLETDVDELVMLSCLTDSGIPLQIRMDYWRTPPVRTLRISGAEGEIHCDLAAGFAELSWKGEILERIELPEDWERNHMFLAATKHFLDSIQEGRAPQIDLQEGLDVLNIALAAKRSLKTGGVETVGMEVEAK